MTWTSHVEGYEQAFFIALAVVAGILFYYATKYATKYSIYVAFVLPPFVCLFVMYENIILSIDNLRGDNLSVQIMLILHALVIPMDLIICFEVAYLVHKTRSVNFFGIEFDSGHRTKRKDVCSIFLRFAIWIIALVLLGLNLAVNFEWLDRKVESIDRSVSLYELSGDSTTHIIFGIIPSMTLVAFSLYIGMQLWRYGSYYSFMVHATYFNPWIWMVAGSIALLIGNLLPTNLYSLSSNAGELLLLLCIIRMFREVHHDLQQGIQMQQFIHPTNITDVGFQYNSPSSSSPGSPAYIAANTPGSVNRHATKTSLSSNPSGPQMPTTIELSSISVVVEAPKAEST